MMLILDMLIDSFRIRLEIAMTEYSKIAFTDYGKYLKASPISLYSFKNYMKYSFFFFW